MFILKKLYADYRARGRRVVLEPVIKYNISQNENIDETSDKKRSTLTRPVQAFLNTSVELFDCLDVTNRQHIAVLFYSQCETSPVYPNVCIKPRVIDMTFYGENDMTLGLLFSNNFLLFFLN